MDDLKAFLDYHVARYNNPNFIPSDPIQVPHQFSKKQDIEIAAFITAVFSWGQRKTIINKSLAFLTLMGNEPYRFVLEHQEKDKKPFESFKHRTFNGTDARYFLHFFQSYYQQNETLEDAFLNDKKGMNDMKTSLTNFFYLFFSLPNHPNRTYKHIPNPSRKSTCKRLNMFLRWMVRSDRNGVDFGIWKNIPTKKLICPFDIHVERVSRKLGLITRKQVDWYTAMELTENLKQLDPNDPVKYDFALFGLGVSRYFELKL